MVPRKSYWSRLEGASTPWFPSNFKQLNCYQIYFTWNSCIFVEFAWTTYWIRIFIFYFFKKILVKTGNGDIPRLSIYESTARTKPMVPWLPLRANMKLLNEDSLEHHCSILQNLATFLIIPYVKNMSGVLLIVIFHQIRWAPSRYFH